MSAIVLREVDKTNWRQTLQLAVSAEQQRFIADYVPVAAIALAKAYIRPDDMLWKPYAIYSDGQMVGFVEIAYEVKDPDTCWIYHFFIDVNYQGKGFGKRALGVLIEFIRTQLPLCRNICLTVHPENLVANRMCKY